MQLQCRKDMICEDFVDANADEETISVREPLYKWGCDFLHDKKKEDE